MPTPTLIPPTPTRHNFLYLHEWADLGTGKGPVYSQDWSPDGLLLATADTENIRVWDVSTRRESGVLAGHTDFVWGLAWSPITPDGTSLLVSASQDGTVRLWDVAANTATVTLNTGWAYCVDWSPDGQRLAVGTNSGEVQVWDVASQQMLHTWQSPTHTAVLSLGWSPDGNTIASGEWGGEIYLWDVATSQVRQAITGYSTEPSDVNGLAWSPDGSRLATTHPDGQVRLWDPATGQLTLTIDAHTGWARGIAWSPDGNLLASTGEDKRIVVWDPLTGLAYAEQHHNHLPVWSVSWSPDGTMVASGAGAYLERHVGATIVWRVP
ncbi:MAG TPA: WD40 repeat domain-containing protein, partial [Anaerolineales bacterium]|nr:WD40 repeat domain-containing protein [Anaerolineales bacterium]